VLILFGRMMRNYVIDNSTYIICNFHRYDVSANGLTSPPTLNGLIGDFNPAILWLFLCYYLLHVMLVATLLCLLDA